VQPVPPLAVRARTELEALRAATDRPAALARLAGWLDRTAYELAAAGAGSSEHAPFADLAREIRAGSLTQDELWARAVALLERLASSPKPIRRAFWKRG
jgi:hypothetical protein